MVLRQKKTLVVPIETKARDLDSRLLLSIKLIALSSNSWEIIFGKTSKVGEYWQENNLGPFVFLGNGPQYEPSYFFAMAEKGGQFVLLDEEGAVYTKTYEDRSPRGGVDNSCIQHFKAIFFWGENEHLNWLRRHGEEHTRKWVVTGNPRFDLCRKDYFGYFQRLRPNQFSQKFVLVNTAFGQANNFISFEDEKEYWSDTKGVVYGKSREDLLAYESRNLPLFIEGIRKVACAYPNYQFVIRPHPIEKSSTYERAFKDLPNASVVQEGAVQEWVCHAAVIIHNGCTTAIEALMAGLEPICFSPIIEDEHIQTLTHNVSEVVQEPEELIELVGKKLRREKTLLEQQQTRMINDLSNYIVNFRHESINKIVDAIDEIEFSIRDVCSPFSPRNTKNQNPVWINYLKNIVRHAARRINDPFDVRSRRRQLIKQKILLRGEQKLPFLTQAELEQRIEEFRRLDSSIPQIDLVELDEKIFRMSESSLD